MRELKATALAQSGLRDISVEEMEQSTAEDDDDNDTVFELSQVTNFSESSEDTESFAEMEKAFLLKSRSDSFSPECTPPAEDGAPMSSRGTPPDEDCAPMSSRGTPPAKNSALTLFGNAPPAQQDSALTAFSESDFHTPMASRGKQFCTPVQHRGRDPCYAENCTSKWLIPIVSLIFLLTKIYITGTAEDFCDVCDHPFCAEHEGMYQHYCGESPSESEEEPVVHHQPNSEAESLDLTCAVSQCSELCDDMCGRCKLGLCNTHLDGHPEVNY